MSTEIVDDGAFDGVDEPFARWCTLITYPPNAGHKFAGLTVRMRGDGSLRMAERRRDWHQANGATAVIQRQAWTPSPWTDVAEVGEAGSEATPNDLRHVGESGETP